MLDTNICIYVIKNKPQIVKENFLKHNINDICISSITFAELMHGAEKSQYPQRTRTAIYNFLSPLKVLSFGSNSAIEYGKIRTSLETKGIPIGPMDMLIAAHAKSLGLTIVTNNTREFEKIIDLQIENWV